MHDNFDIPLSEGQFSNTYSFPAGDGGEGQARLTALDDFEW